jgi:predicted amidohydrolase YtcJ
MATFGIRIKKGNFVPITAYWAREIVTLDSNCPSAEVVAVLDERILHVGTYGEAVEALRDQMFTTNDRYANSVIVPGFIEAAPCRR